MNDGVADITAQLVRALFEKMEQVKEQEADAYWIYQEMVNSLEMQVKERIESDLRDAQLKREVAQQLEVEKKDSIPLEQQFVLYQNVAGR